MDKVDQVAMEWTSDTQQMVVHRKLSELTVCMRCTAVRMTDEFED